MLQLSYVHKGSSNHMLRLCYAHSHMLVKSCAALDQLISFVQSGLVVEKRPDWGNAHFVCRDPYFPPLAARSSTGMRRSYPISFWQTITLWHNTCLDVILFTEKYLIPLGSALWAVPVPAPTVSPPVPVHVYWKLSTSNYSRLSAGH
ncbi:hypothetical protein ATANTOWER_029654 [Ataeniobius toweri]|uniref:Uncharacterized protein n=1 Tax=Ataeniobius toweri TaxID=208326 RepID=A0ABU7A8X0_9TELE|nr:hypothetical protein [Ataeniobius toweri]